ncbi:MAG: DUF5689 domain-containing protein [Flavobacteriales bacterium]
MNTTLRNSLVITLVTTLLVLTGCKKDFDSPPITVLPVGNIITIDSLRKIYTSFDSTFVNDYSVFGTVTADEISGNLYKTIYIQDGTAGILLKLTASSDKTFFQGDKVRVSLRGTKISSYRSMIQLDNVNPDVNLIKQGKGNEIVPKVVTRTDLQPVGTYSPYQGQLIQINDVEFQCVEKCKTWADAITQSSRDLFIQDTTGATIIIRSSGFASFANQEIPMGKGSVIALVSQFDNKIQLVIRNPSEQTLYGARKTICPYINKNFDDKNLFSCGWTTKLVSGPTSTVWGMYLASNSAAKVSNYDPVSSSNVACESWLISPSINLLNATNPTLSFRNVVNYSTTPKLEVLVSTNYDGISDPNTATWTDLTSLAIWDNNATTWSSWTSSGNISLSAYQQSSVYVAFRLIGNTTNASTWELDDVLVKDN